MNTTSEDDVSPILSRKDAEPLLAHLQTLADQKRRGRTLFRQATSIGGTALLLTALLLARSFLVGAPPALAFSSCQPVEPSGSAGGILGLLVRSPGVVLVDRAGSATIRPESVTVRCALEDSKLIAIRVTSVISPFDEISVETWFQTPQIQASSSGMVVDIGDRRVQTRVLSGGRAFALTPLGYPGIALVIIRGGSVSRVLHLGMELDVATRTSTDLASAYDIALSERSTITIHPTPSPTSWSFDVSSQDELIARLGTLGLSPIAILPDSQPQHVDVFQGEAGLVVKTTYPDADGGGVRVVQSENAPVEPAGGTVVQVHGAYGLQVGTTVYWTESGYELAVDASDGDVIGYANSLQWVTP